MKQFQYTGWPEEGVPDSGSGFIDLIGQVQKWQRSSGDKPIVAHCSGGTGRTGTFIAVSILLERLKTEGVVDVFHTVRGLRLQRPGMVHTVVCRSMLYRIISQFETAVNSCLLFPCRINMSLSTRPFWSIWIHLNCMLISSRK